MHSTDTPINVSSRIERLPRSSFHIGLTMVLAIAWFVESIDLGGLGYILPAVGKHFKLTPTVMGLLASMSAVGMLVGSFISGSLSDKFGRKKVFIAAMAFWGIAAGLSGFSWSFESLLVYRILLGIGIGVQTPIGMAWLGELVPSKYRGKYLAIYEAFLPVGLITAGLAAYFVLPRFDWRGVLLVEALPAFWLIVVWKLVPESPFWLDSKGRSEEAHRIVSVMEEKIQKIVGGTLPPIAATIETITIAESNQTNVQDRGLRELLTKKYVKSLFMSGFMMFAGMFSYYGLTTWFSTLLMAHGFSITKSITFVTLIQIGGIFSSLLVPYLVEKSGRKWAQIIVTVGMAVTAYAYGSSNAVIYVIGFGLLFQLFQTSQASVASIYVPEMWSTNVRVTGTGFAYGVGRLGAILGPIVLGAFMQSYGPMSVFVACSVMLIIEVLVILVLGPETRGKVF